MIENLITSGLVEFLTEQAEADEMEGFIIRPHDSDEALEGPPLIVVKTSNCVARVRKSNLFNADVTVTLRANPADTDIAAFESIWAWLSSKLYPGEEARVFLDATDGLGCYTLQSSQADSDVTLEDNERRRDILITGAFLAKNLIP